jgi:hypothetical protein
MRGEMRVREGEDEGEGREEMRVRGGKEMMVRGGEGGDEGEGRKEIRVKGGRKDEEGGRMRRKGAESDGRELDAGKVRRAEMRVRGGRK